MKKNLIILIAAVCVLVIVIAVNKKQYKLSNSSKPVMAGLNITEGSITGFRVIQGSDTVLVTKKDGKWITGDNEWPADTGKVGKLLETMFTLEDREVVSRNPERAGEFGLDSASLKEVVLYKSGSEEVFKASLGKTSSTMGGSSYWSKGPGTDVYRTLASFSYAISSRAKDWLDKKLFTADKDEFTELKVAWKDSTGELNNFSLQKNGDNWEMTAPKPGNAKKNLVEGMLNRIIQWELDEFPQESETPKMDTEPEIDVSFTLSDGTKYAIKAREAEGSFYYIKFPGREEIVKLKDWRFVPLRKTVEDLYEEPPPPAADSADEGRSQADK